MKLIYFTLALLAITQTVSAARPKGRVAERPRYGTNYTVPFAHAYRALDELGFDRHKAIDRDVYHMARLGFDAFRLHLWDVELSDSAGNLIDNEHLELLDYLVMALQKRGIDIIFTAQTNFGNGYPEVNTDPNGAFSYDFEKCQVHDNPLAQEAQERYLSQLVNHVNRYTGRRIADDPDIIAIEINNEPCHSGTEEEITAYVNRMAKAIRRQGWKKDILYNVSHNLWRTPAFYKAAINGTTYQWYPTGLVKGAQRKGNFLPVLDNYEIPFDTIPGFDRMSRVVYEYDPADVLDTYLYPAAARTFRKAGFDWITQFAYDPIDMAVHNSEYQTHFLNLAYTPGKAIGMMIAAEATRNIPRGKNYGTYPRDTVFGEDSEFLVSARRNLAMLNNGRQYLHTNNCSEPARDFNSLRRIAGTGSSPMVSTDGTGAYFLDRLDNGVWRLEIMPDVYIVTDPFATPSLKRNVASIINRSIDMTLNLPGLDNGFAYKAVDNNLVTMANGRRVSLTPGVWLLGSADAIESVKADDKFASNMNVGEYVAPKETKTMFKVLNNSLNHVNAGNDINIEICVVADVLPDSILIYPAEASMWNRHNRLYTLERTGYNKYNCVISAADIGKKDCFSYSIVAFHNNGTVSTWPSGRVGTPVDWDFAPQHDDRYNVSIITENAAVPLIDLSRDHDDCELSTVPETWSGVEMKHLHRQPMAENRLRLHKDHKADTHHLILSKRVADLPGIENTGADSRIIMRLGTVEGVDSVNVNLVDGDGFSHCTSVAVSTGSVAEIPLASLAPGPTWLTPAPYPSFLERRFIPEQSLDKRLDPTDIESIVIDMPVGDKEANLEIIGVFIENN